MAGQAGVACERPDLAGGGRHFGNGASGEHYDDDSGHGVGAGVGLGGVREDLDEGVASGGLQDV